MIKCLRKKFTIVAMCSMFFVLATIMVIFNFLNYIRLVDNADRTLHMIADNDGKFPSPRSQDNESGEMNPKPEKEDATESKSENEEDVSEAKSEKKSEDQEKKKRPPSMKRGEMSPEAPYRTRYFSVQMDEDGNIVSHDLQHIASVTEKEAGKYAKKIFYKHNAKGFWGNYRYRKIQEDTRTVVIFLDSSEEMKSFRTNLLTSMLVSGGGLLAVFVLVLIFSGIVFRPVAESYEKQKRFITDASHELKTPLTIIDANVAVIEMERGEDEWTTSIRKQIRRLADFTQQLITLTKLEEREIRKQRQEISLSKLVMESVQSFEVFAKTNGKMIETDVQEQITMPGDEKLIRQLFGILLDNAVKYSLEGSLIHVSLMKKGKRMHFEIYNETEAIPKGNLDILFERFYRLDVSRNSETGGSGIGLSVAHAIVETHHGKIRAKSDDGKSIQVSVEFYI